MHARWKLLFTSLCRYSRDCNNRNKWRGRCFGRFSYALHENMGIETAIITGHAAAASVRGIGTSDKVESFQRSREIANKWGWRDAF